MEKERKKFWPYILTATFALMVLAVLRLVYLITVMPEPEIGKLDVYKEIVRPNGYQTKYDARKYYEQAFNDFVSLSLDYQWEIRNRKVFERLYDTDLLQVEHHVQENAEVFETLMKACERPYSYFEIISDDGLLHSIRCHEISYLKEIYNLLLMDVKLAGICEDYERAFKDIRLLNIISDHLLTQNCNSYHFYSGYRARSYAVAAGYYLIKYCNIPREDIERLRDDVLLNIAVNPSDVFIDIERIMALERLDGIMVPTKNNSGRFAWQVVSKNVYFGSDSGFLGVNWQNCFTLVNACFLGPRESDFIAMIDRVTPLTKEIFKMKPFEVNQDKTGVVARVQQIIEEDISGMSNRIASFYLLKAIGRYQSQAVGLATVASIRLFELDNGRLPVSLAELQECGYISESPEDIYTGNELIYRLIRDEYLLYSVGENYTDDGGDYYFEVDDVFWPKVEWVKPIEIPLEIRGILLR